MKIKIFMILIVLLAGTSLCSAEAQTTQHVVKVYDGVTGDPIENVNVAINGKMYTTDSTGRTDVAYLEVGKPYTHTISKQGYDTQVSTITPVKPTITVSILNAIGIHPGYTTYLLPVGVSYEESQAPSILKNLKSELESFVKRTLNL